jgi:hypothetical protein
MTREEILDEMIRHFRGVGIGRPRKYVGGLLPAFCDFLIEIGTPERGFHSLDEMFQEFPQITSGVSTLTVSLPSGNQKTIRPSYERYHHLYIAEHRRLDFPRSQPYATGKWADYRDWLDGLVKMSEEDLRWLAQHSVEFVLEELEEQTFDPASIRIDPPIFRWLLEEFEFGARAKGEPTGAAFQAMVFGYVRADAPHLQVEARKARAGSARTQGVGDIDAWEGDRLVISAEVKHFAVAEKDLDGFTHFAANVCERSALGMVVAEDFEEGVRSKLIETGLVAVSRKDLLQIVALWDPLKQRAAFNAFQWVVVHKEQNSGLIRRVREFFEGLAGTDNRQVDGD